MNNYTCAKQIVISIFGHIIKSVELRIAYKYFRGFESKRPSKYDCCYECFCFEFQKKQEKRICLLPKQRTRYISYVVFTYTVAVHFYPCSYCTLYAVVGIFVASESTIEEAYTKNTFLRIWPSTDLQRKMASCMHWFPEYLQYRLCENK